VVPSAETGQLVARLCDVAPGGSSSLVTLGVLNLTHRDGHAEPRPLVPGEPVEVRVPLTATAHAFAPGHRVRLALAPAYWPWAWPAPGGLDLRLRTEGAALVLPARSPRPEDDDLAPLGPAEVTEPYAYERLAPVEVTRTFRRDSSTRTIRSDVEMSYFGGFRLADGLEYRERGFDTFEAQPRDPLTACTRSTWTVELGRGDWQTRIDVACSMRCDAADFVLEAGLAAFANGETVIDRRWETRIPRDLA
jgi:hypothetical protein